MLALIDEAVGEAARQLPGRLIGIVEVVAAILAGQQHVEHIVPVVVPLRIDVLAEMRRIVVVLEHQMHVPSRLDGGTHRGGHLVHPVLIQDGMHRIEAQSVEAVLHQPVEHVVGEEGAHLGPAEIDRRIPTAYDGPRERIAVRRDDR